MIRRSALLTASILALAPGAARAQTPPPAATPPGVPPGYVLWTPLVAYPLPEPTPEPSVEMVRKSPELLLGGVLLLSFGGVAIIAGASMVAGAGNASAAVCPSFGPCPMGLDPNPGLKTAGIGAMIGGVIGIAAGIPLMVVGNRRVPAGPDGEPTAWLTPTVRVGAGTGTLTWSF